MPIQQATEGRPREQFLSQTGTLGQWETNAPDDGDWSGDDESYFPVTRLRTQYIDYLAAKELEIEEQQQGRHYYHGAQYTAREIEILRNRRQPIITYNRMGRKIDSIVGLVQRLKQDPKAYPTSPKNADGAEIATQCVRAVLQGSAWNYVDPFCAGQAGTEGIAGIELKLVDGDHQDPDVAFDYVFGDDFFYDPRSFKADFSDARYMGISKWIDVEEAVELFPDQEDLIRSLMVDNGFDLYTHSDREYKWVYVNEQRIRLVEHWYKYRGKWYWAFYCSNLLLDQGVSPFLDERNRPMSRFIMFSAFVDHEGDRYGFVRNLKGPQDELNQRRSKTLFMSNVTALYVEKGSVDDVERTRRERARPDGLIEYNTGFKPPADIQNEQQLQHQLALMQDARTEIDTFANINPQLLMAGGGPDEHSGVAINYLQKAGIAELGSFLRNYRDWKWRVYRAIWNIVVRTWNGERFIRVTDNQGLAQFIQINGMELDQYGQPTIINAIGALNVEMDLDEGPDEASLMQDTYDQIKLDQNIPFAVKLEFMPVSESKKAQIRKLMQAPPNPLQVRAATAQVAQAEAEVGETQARTQDRIAQSMERRARSITDIARGAHLATEAHLNGQQIATFGMEQSANQPNPANPSDYPQNPPQAPQPFQGTPQTTQAQQPQQPAQPNLGGARQAPDGHFYTPDPRRPGKYLRLRHAA